MVHSQVFRKELVVVYVVVSKVEAVCLELHQVDLRKETTSTTRGVLTSLWSYTVPSVDPSPVSEGKEATNPRKFSRGKTVLRLPDTCTCSVITSKGYFWK